jgi:hypothetical protein
MITETNIRSSDNTAAFGLVNTLKKLYDKLYERVGLIRETHKIWLSIQNWRFWQWLAELFVAMKPVRHLLFLMFLWIFLIFKVAQGKEVIAISMAYYFGDHLTIRDMLNLALTLFSFIIFSLTTDIQCRAIFNAESMGRKAQAPYNPLVVRQIQEVLLLFLSFVPPIYFFYHILFNLQQRYLSAIPLLIFYLFMLYINLKRLWERKRSVITESADYKVYKNWLDTSRSADNMSDTVRASFDRVVKAVKKLYGDDTIPFLKGDNIIARFANKLWYLWVRERDSIAQRNAGLRLFWTGFSFLIGLTLVMLLVDSAYGIGTIALTLLGFSIVALMVSALLVWRHRYNFPFHVAALVALVFFRYCNINHDARSTDMLTTPPSVKTDMSAWLDTHFKTNPTQTENVYFIAAEGGGIRSAYWTLGVLQKIYADNPTLLSRTYAFSTVSGGTVGVANFVALYHDALMAGEPLPSDSLSKAVLSKDLLSPVIAGLFFPDALQRILPFNVKMRDRAAMFEDAWSKDYAQVFKGSRTLDKSLLSLYADTKTRHKLPNVFFNTTLTETGAKAVFSNLKLDTSYFPQDVDIQYESRRDFLLKSAAFASSRFPFVSPPAGIKHQNGQTLFNVVDGGYFENSGMHTALELVHLLNDLKAEKGLTNVRPYILFIQNSTSDAFTNIHHIEPNKLFYESMTPLKTFLNAWDAKVAYFKADFNWLKESVYFDYRTIGLNDNGYQDIALGWVLSKNTRARMDSAIANLNIQVFRKRE